MEKTGYLCAIDENGVTVEITELDEELEAVTLEVVDPDGNTVEVKEEDLIAGTTQATFEFTEALTEVTEGDWEVNGVVYDAKKAAAVVAVDDALTADSVADLSDALTVDYAEYFTNVDEDNMASYLEELVAFGTVDTVEEIQDIIDEVNPYEQYATAIITAETDLELRTALRDADEAGLIERYNEDYLDQYWDYHNTSADSYTDSDGNTDQYDLTNKSLEEIQSDFIDFVNVEEAGKAYTAALEALNQELVDDARTAFEWVNAETDTEIENLEDAKADLNNHELFIAIDEADSKLSLKTALNNLGEAELNEGVHKANADKELATVYDELLEDYVTAFDTDLLAVDDTTTTDSAVNIEDINSLIESVGVVPVFEEAVVESAVATDVVVTFDNPIAETTDKSGFTVMVDGTEATIDSAAATAGNAYVTLTLSDPVVQGQEVTVSYDGDAGAIVDNVDSNPARSFTNEEVTNNVESIDSGELTFDAEDVDGKAEYDAGDQITLTTSLLSGTDVFELDGTYDVKVEFYATDSADDTRGDLLEVYHDEITFTDGVGDLTIEALTAAPYYQDVVVTVKEVLPNTGDLVIERTTDGTEADLTINPGDIAKFNVEVTDATDISAVAATIAAKDAYKNPAADFIDETAKVVELSVERDGSTVATQNLVANDGKVELDFTSGNTAQFDGTLNMSGFIDELQEDDVLTVSYGTAEGSITITEAMVQ